MSWILSTLAMAPPAGGAGAGQQQSPMYFIGMMGVMFVALYFIMIRPGQKRAKERQKLLDAIKSGDRVVFSGGILGVVTNVKEKTLMIKIADNVKVEVSRAAVAQVLAKGDSPEDQQN